MSPCRRPLVLAPFALAAALCAAHAQERADVDTVIATVDGVEITAGHLVMMRAQLPQQYQSLPDAALFGGLVDQAIQQQLMAAEVPELNAAGRIMLDNQERNLRANVEAQRVFDAELTEEAIVAAYEARYADAAEGMEFNASHILVETEAEAQEVRAAIAEGADFAETAQARSTGPSGPNGGSLGWFGAGMMVPAFEKAVMELSPGEVSQPVETQFGWHIIRLDDARQSDKPPLSEVRSEIVGQLQQQILETRLAELEGGAEITRMTAEDIAPDFLSDRGLLEN